MVLLTSWGEIIMSYQNNIAVKKYQQSEKGRKTRKLWNNSKKGKKSRKKYLLSEKGKKAEQKSYKKYLSSEKCKLTTKRKNERIKIKKKQIMKELKINGCAICSYNKCIASLDFHHVNPEDKSFSLSIDGLIRKDEFIIKELNKCILLCKNCHYEIENKQRGN